MTSPNLPGPDLDAALDFLKRFRAYPVHLAAIPAEGGDPKGKLFLPKRQDGTNKTPEERTEEIRSWISTWNGEQRWNVYLTLNKVRRDFVKNKPRESDIVEVRTFKVDLDPRPIPPDWKGTDAEWVEAERKRILASLTTDLPEGVPGPPTFVIDSGGGFWGLWKFEMECPSQEADDVLRLKVAGERLVEMYRKHLGQKIADGVANLDRLCRLPGSVNYPNERKRTKGRTVQVAALVEPACTGRRYGPAQFVPPGEYDKPKATKRSRKKAAVTQIDSLDALPSKFPGVKHGRERMDACKVVIAQGCDPDNPWRFGGPETTYGLARGLDWTGDRSKAVWYVCCELVRSGVDDDTIRALLLDDGWGISDHVLDQKNPEACAERQIEKAREEVGDDVGSEAKAVLDRHDPRPSARQFVRREAPELLLYNGDWLEYARGAYHAVEDGIVEARLYDFLERAQRREKDGDGWKLVPFKPGGRDVSEVTRALKSLTIRAQGAFDPPCWIGEPGPLPLEIISCANGLLHLPTGELHPPSPSFFTRNALDIGYDPKAGPPTRWLRFLDDLWAHDPESIDVLQEVMGYLLVPDTKQQKVFLLIGPSRSGKGTIGRVLRQLVGKANVVGSAVNSLGTPFGLEPLIGKQLSLVSDMRLGKRSDPAAIAENLLRISGGDLVDANRKHKTVWTGTLAVRFVIMTNELPQFEDASGALANRFVPLKMTESFLGREDHDLDDRLRPELPGILNWAIEGWRRLQDRGRFVLPGSARQTIQDLGDLAAPVAAFVRDRCVLEPGASILKDALYAEYQAWCAEQGRAFDIKDVFSRNLLAATRVQAKKGPRPDRTPMFQGIRLVASPDEETFG
jgi:P4 family phage/plasmid primase-like protien